MARFKDLSYVSIKQMRQIDKNAVKNGIKIDLMMENAGNVLAKFLNNRFGSLYGKKIVCVVGRGNNGGGVIASKQQRCDLDQEEKCVL